MKRICLLLKLGALILICPLTSYSNQHSQSIELKHEQFEVTYSSAGVRFCPTAENMEWNWQLKSISGIDKAVNLVVPTLVSDKDVIYRRKSITEQYLFRGNSIEQQFIIHSSLHLSGDLVIEGTVKGDGSFKKVEGGWTWEKGDANVYLGNVYVYDADQNPIKASMEVSSCLTRIVIDFHDLKNATYPVTIDPQIGTDDFVLSNSGARLYQPKLIFNASSNNFFSVWTTFIGSGLSRNEDIHGGSFTRDQVRSTPYTVDQSCGYASFIVSGSPPAGSGLNSAATTPDVAYCGSNYLVVWEDYKGSGFIKRRIMKRLTTGSSTSSDTSSIFGDDAFTSTYGYARYPAVAGNNNKYLVACVADGTGTTHQIIGKYVQTDGTPETTAYLPIFSTTSGKFVDVDVDARPAGNFAVAAATLNSIHYGWASASSMVSSGSIPGLGNIGTVSVAAKDNSTFLLVWSELSGSKFIIKGSLSGGTPFQIDQFSHLGCGKPAVAYDVDNGSWLVVWHGNPNTNYSRSLIWGREVNSDGSMGDVFPVSKQARTSVSPSVAYDSQNKEFWIAWSGGGNKDQIFAQRWIRSLTDCTISMKRDTVWENNYKRSPFNFSTDKLITKLYAKTSIGDSIYPLNFYLVNSDTLQTSYLTTSVQTTMTPSSTDDYLLSRNQLFFTRNDSINYEIKNRYYPRVFAQSETPGVYSSTQMKTIKVVDVNEFFKVTFDEEISFLEDESNTSIPFSIHSGDAGKERNSIRLNVTHTPSFMTWPTLATNPIVPGGGHSDPIPRTAVIKDDKLLFSLVANGNGTSLLQFNLTDLKGGEWQSLMADRTASFSIPVTVTPVNDPPAGTDGTVTVFEDNDRTFSAADFGFTDPFDEPDNKFNFLIINAIPSIGEFTLNTIAVSDGDVISAADIPDLKYSPPANAYGLGLTSLTFQVQDNGGTENDGVDLDQSPNILIFNITAVNDPPSGADKTITISEDNNYTFAVPDFGFSDPLDFSYNSLLNVKILTLPSSGILKINETPVISGQFVAATDIPNMKFSPASHDSGEPYTSFSFQVQDDGGTLYGGKDMDQSPNTITINVIQINDPPSGTDGTVTILEDNDHTFSAADFGFTDPFDDPANSLTSVIITTIPTAGEFKLNTSLISDGDEVSVSDIPNLKYSPPSNAYGPAFTNLTFQVRDNGGTDNGGVDTDQSANILSVDITPVNDAPAFTPGEDVNIDEVAGAHTVAAWATDISPGNIYESAQILSFVVSNNNNSLFSVQPAISALTGDLTFTPAANANGSAEVSVILTDDGGTDNGGVDSGSETTFTITITSLNEEPAGTDKTVTIAEDNPFIFAATDFGFTDPLNSPPDNLLAVKITTIPGSGELSLNGVPVVSDNFIEANDIPDLEFTPTSNENGTPYAKFTFQVQDDGGTENGGVDLDQSPNTFTFNVTSVNDPPSGADKTITIDEDNNYVFAVQDFGFSDPLDVPSNSLLNVKILTLPSSGILKINETTISAGQFVAATDIPKMKFSPASDDSGEPYSSFSFQVQDNGGTSSGGTDLDQSPNTITINVIPVNDPPSVNNDHSAQTVQYSDPILQVTISAFDVDNTYEDLLCTTSWKKSTDAGFSPGLPSNLDLEQTTDAGLPKRWLLKGQMMTSPGTYIVRVTVNDGTSNPADNTGYTDIEVIVAREDARVTYTGAMFVSTDGITSSNAIVTLAATVQDITADPGDPAYDDFNGDIRNAQVYLKVLELSVTLGPFTPVLVSPDDLTTGTVMVNWPVNIGSADSKQFTIAIEVNGYYLRNSSEDDAIVTVSKPLDEFITGGGYIKLNNSAGKKAGDAGSKNNFGFNVKFNKKKTSLKGSISILIRRTENNRVRVYRIKGNSMTSLSVQPATFSMPPAAVFNGKASIQDFTNPDAPLSVDGNATLQVTMTDFGESGGEQNLSNPDRIAITVWDKSGGLWFASSWNGKKTIEQRLEAGNLKINSSGSVVTGTYPSKTELASSTDEPVPGDPIIFTATVTGQTTMKPTGTVTFIDYFNSTFSILGNHALNQGSATLNVSSLASGLHEIYAFYGGDSKYKSSTGFLLQKVNLAATAFNSFANVSPVIENANWKVYPNPFSESLHFEFMSPVDTKAQIKIFDNTGRIIKTIFNNPVKADVTYHAEFTPTTSTSGFYLFQIVIGSEIFNGKAIYKE